MKGPLRVGFIGLGMAGRDHLARIVGCPDAAAAYAADPGSNAQDHASREASGIVCFDDYRSMLEQDDLDLVIVATPHCMHETMAVDSLRAGKHVLCEKPLAITTEQCDRMIAAADAAGRTLFVGQNQRLSPVFSALRETLTEHPMGAPVGGVVQYLGFEGTRMAAPDNWKGSYEQAGGGVLLDGGCHVVDLCNWYFGRPVGVTALSLIHI